MRCIHILLLSWALAFLSVTECHADVDIEQAARLARKQKVSGKPFDVPVPAASLIIDRELERLHSATLEAVGWSRIVERRRSPSALRADALSEVVRSRARLIKRMTLLKIEAEADIETVQAHQKGLFDEILPKIQEQKLQELALRDIRKWLSGSGDRLFEVTPPMRKKEWLAAMGPDVREVFSPMLEKLETAGSRRERKHLNKRLALALDRFIEQSSTAVKELQKQALMVQTLRSTRQGLSIDLAPMLEECIRENHRHRVLEESLVEQLRAMR